MSVVHNHPHPLALQVVTPVNSRIFQKYGRVRVEDWDDRVSGLTWDEQISRGSFPSANSYWDLTQDPAVSIDQPLGQQLPSQPYAQQVVRCHTLDTGAVILLHTDWLPDGA